MAEHKIIDFSVGSKYTTVTGLSCEVTAVADSFIRVTYNNETTVKYPKMLFAGVFVALNHRNAFHLF
jgi:preprotein translocase subunit YajC